MRKVTIVFAVTPGICLLFALGAVSVTWGQSAAPHSPTMWQRRLLFTCDYGTAANEVLVTIPGETADIGPDGIYADEQGNVHIRGTQNLKKFSPDGELLWMFPAPCLGGVIVAPDGAVWLEFFSEELWTDVLGYLSPDGELEWTRPESEIIEEAWQGGCRLVGTRLGIDEFVKVGEEAGALFSYNEGPGGRGLPRFWWVDAEGKFRGELPGRYTPLGFLSPKLTISTKTEHGISYDFRFVDLNVQVVNTTAVTLAPHRSWPWHPSFLVFDEYHRCYSLDTEPLTEPVQLRDEEGWTVEREWAVNIYGADGETATITGINGNNLTLNIDLQNSYDAGYPRANGRGAAIAKQATQVYDADVVSRVWDAFSGAADGSDGGCFVGVKILDDGGTNVPYKEFLSGPTSSDDYSDVWFKNKGKSNYVHVIGAHRYDAFQDLYGISEDALNYQATFIKNVTTDYPDAVAVVNADVTAHELGHQVCNNPADVDAHHPAVWCHLGPETDRCLMAKQYDPDEMPLGRHPEDPYSEFCHEGPDHIDDWRDALDNL